MSIWWRSDWPPLTNILIQDTPAAQSAARDENALHTTSGAAGQSKKVKKKTLRTCIFALLLGACLTLQFVRRHFQQHDSTYKMLQVLFVRRAPGDEYEGVSLSYRGASLNYIYDTLTDV